MKLVYIANARLPTERAHGIQIMKTCEALQKAGVEVSLWLPKRRNPRFAVTDIFDYYQIPARFPIHWLPCVDLIGWLNFLPGLAYYLQSKSFARSVAAAVDQLADDDTIFYSRDVYTLEPLRRAGRSYFYETHTISPSPSTFQQRVFQQAAGIIAISRHLAEEFYQQVPSRKVLVAEDGVDLSLFSASMMSKQEARQWIGLPLQARIILYAGHLYPWKGVQILAQASEYLDGDAVVYVVGGIDEDIRAFSSFVKRSRISRVRVVGRVAHEQIPVYLASADVLVLPNSAKFTISELHTSPLKLFEYMAARRPIVASDLPSLREILDETRAVFCVPDDPISLARKVNLLLGDSGLAERIATKAYEKVQHFSWDARAKKILGFIQQRVAR